MEKPFIEIDADEVLMYPQPAQPVDGYEFPCNEQGQRLPFCCGAHTQVYNNAVEWFKIFPDCCNSHKKMVTKSWYYKGIYHDVAERIVNAVSYTETIISTRINNDDWYDDITDYIDYVVACFGHPAVGLHIYMDYIKNRIKDNIIVPDKKKQAQLLDFISTYYKTKELKTQEKTSLNILYSTYQKWLKIFPFEISFFSSLKQNFESRLPVIEGKFKVNRYSGIAKGKLLTKSRLIDVLVEQTEKIVLTINIKVLHDKQLLTEPDRIKLELIVAERQMKLDIGYINRSKTEEQRYRKILKEWFEDEKKFVDEITPLLNKLSIKAESNATVVPQQNIKLKIDQVALYYVYENKQITRMNGDEIAKQYGHTSGEKLFQRFTYYSSTANRKGKPVPCTPTKLKNKIELIESIIQLLTGNNVLKANDEVTILKTILETEYQ
jgi:hypothetical protein